MKNSENPSLSLKSNKKGKIFRPKLSNLWTHDLIMKDKGLNSKQKRYVAKIHTFHNTETPRPNYIEGKESPTEKLGCPMTNRELADWNDDSIWIARKTVNYLYEHEYINIKTEIVYRGKVSRLKRYIKVNATLIDPHLPYRGLKTSSLIEESDTTDNEKYILAMADSFISEGKICRISNGYIGNLLDLSEIRISHIILGLKKRNMLDIRIKRHRTSDGKYVTSRTMNLIYENIIPSQSDIFGIESSEKAPNMTLRESKRTYYSTLREAEMMSKSVLFDFERCQKAYYSTSISLIILSLIILINKGYKGYALSFDFIKGMNTVIMKRLALGSDNVELEAENYYRNEESRMGTPNSSSHDSKSPINTQEERSNEMEDKTTENTGFEFINNIPDVESVEADNQESGSDTVDSKPLHHNDNVGQPPVRHSHGAEDIDKPPMEYDASAENRKHYSAEHATDSSLSNVINFDDYVEESTAKVNADDAVTEDMDTDIDTIETKDEVDSTPIDNPYNLPYHAENPENETAYYRAVSAQ